MIRPHGVAHAHFRLSRNADAYHTVYNLAGLASAQHRVFSSRKRIEENRGKWVDNRGSLPNGRLLPGCDDEGWQAMRREAFVAALGWVEDEGASRYIGGSGNRLVSLFRLWKKSLSRPHIPQNASHPLFNLTMTSTRGIMQHFYGQKII